MSSKLHDLVHELAATLRIRNTTGNQEQEAWWLIEKVTKKHKAELLAQLDFALTKDQEKTLEHWVNQHVNDKKPLQYILGSVPFCSLDILVQPPTLIPRPETEEMTRWLIEMLSCHQIPLNMLDLCCGTGCIGLALAKALPSATVVGTDIDDKALQLAHKNKLHNKIQNISFIQSDLFNAIYAQNKFDVIVSNPPYLSQESYQKVDDEIRLWEDKHALVAQNHGMAVYEQIIPQAHKYLKKTRDNKLPQLILEFGIDQKPDMLKKLLQENGFAHVEIHKDLQNKERWIVARYAPI